MGLFKNKEPTVLIRVTDFERRIIITALRNLRDKQIKENKDYGQGSNSWHIQIKKII